MADLCHQCGLPSDGDARPLKMLPCGHMACVACLGERAQSGARRCPVCHKILKVDVSKLATYRVPEAYRVWCRDCDAVARAGCLEEHAVCGQGPLRREAAAALADVCAARAAALQALAEDVRRETAHLQQEESASASLGLVSLRAALAAARSHPLHGLRGLNGHPTADGGLLHRALAALRREGEHADQLGQGDHGLEKQRAVLKEQADLVERERASLVALADQLEAKARDLEKKEKGLADAKAELEVREAALGAKEQALSQREAALQAERLARQEEQKALELERATLQQEKAALKKEEFFRAISMRAKVVVPTDREPGEGSRQVAVEGESGPPETDADAGPSPSCIAEDAAVLTGLLVGSSPQGAGPSTTTPSSPTATTTAGPSAATPVISNEAADGAAEEDDDQGSVPAPSWSALPDELLERVLSLVPAGRHGKTLLRLRLVCRRWAGLIKTSAAVWRRRTLWVKFHRIRGVVLGAAALRCAPALACLKLETRANEEPAHTRRTMRAVQRCQTEVLRLEMRVPVTSTVDQAGSAALEALRPSLRELDLHMTFNGMCGPPNAIVQSVKRLVGLTSLKISKEFGNKCCLKETLDWELRTLTKLERLVVGSELSKSMVHILLEASKATLLEVDFGSQEVPDAVVACSALKAVTARATARATGKSLSRLRRVRTLEKLTLVVHAPTSLMEVASFLDSSKQMELLQAVNLAIHSFQPGLSLRHLLPSLDDRVRSVELFGNLAMSREDLELCLAQLPWLRRLRFRCVHLLADDDDWWPGGLAAWAELSILPPQLAELHVHSWVDMDSRAWVEELQAVRPDLRICTATDAACGGVYQP